MIPYDRFPNLNPHNHRITSPASPDYNCIAWSAGDTNHWWQPGLFWPVQATKYDCGIGDLMEAFAKLGFESCDDGSFEAGFEKLALYGSSFLYSHAARQLSNGRWSSKLGGEEDIEHDSPEDVAGGVYGEVAQFMKRPVQP